MTASKTFSVSLDSENSTSLPPTQAPPPITPVGARGGYLSPTNANAWDIVQPPHPAEMGSIDWTVVCIQYSLAQITFPRSQFNKLTRKVTDLNSHLSSCVASRYTCRRRCCRKLAEFEIFCLFMYIYCTTHSAKFQAFRVTHTNLRARRTRTNMPETCDSPM